MEFIDYRVRIHQLARGGTFPECTKEDRWEQPESWAVMKHGNKKATKVFKSDRDETKEQAEECAQDLVIAKGVAYSVEHRPGESTRCALGYCPVTEWCEQWAAIPH